MKKCKIKSVKPLGKQKVYNVTMKSDQHNYFIYDENTNSFVPTSNSHSASYAMLAYQTAYLKYYYPLEFMCSLLTSEISNSDKNVKLELYKEEARRMGIIVKNPDINKSKYKFVITKFKDTKTGKEKYGIRTPLSVIKNLGKETVPDIVANQPFYGLKDFLKKVNGRKVNSKVFKALVENDCMLESFKETNEELLENYDSVRAQVTKEKKQDKKKKEKLEKYGGQSIFDKFSGDLDF